MTDTLECPCGQRLRLARNRAARRIRCPTCQTVLDVPAELRDEADAPETVAVVEELTCPGCRKRWPTDTAVCIDCGHDFRSGRKVRRTVQATEETVNMGWSGFFGYTRFTVRRDPKNRWWLVKRTWFLFFGGKPTEIPLSEYTAVATDHQQSGDDEEATHKFYLYLEGRGKSRRIWSGGRDDKMRELIDVLRTNVGLAIRRK